jgi:hypothetical protein
MVMVNYSLVMVRVRVTVEGRDRLRVGVEGE